MAILGKINLILKLVYEPVVGLEFRRLGMQDETCVKIISMDSFVMKLACQDTVKVTNLTLFYDLLA